MKKFLLAIATIAFVVASCSKSDPTPKPEPQPEPKPTPEENTDILYVPYFESQLTYMSMEFTVKKPDGSTESIKLNKDTAKDATDFSASKKQDLINLAEAIDITEPVHVFKVYGGTSTGTNKHQVSVKIKPTGTYSSTGKANFGFGVLLKNGSSYRTFFSTTVEEAGIKTLCETYSNDLLCSW